MSSELRVKKLRGSGGYVIASLTDEQQSKASIGGPDLFLAPLCRMNPEKISKHLCNICDKEFEGAPKIQYENPNEEVAAGIVLIEKGRYLCGVCDTTIAEYREFRKEEEGQPAASAEAAEAAATAPQPEALTTQGQQAEADTQPQPPEATTPEQEQPATAATAEEVSTINGRAVYDENATKIGTVKQIGTDASNTVVLVITQNDGSDATIPWSRIGKVGEIVLLGNPAKADAEPEPQDRPGKCGSCSFENDEGSKFCEECGAKL